ncbi:MAG: acyl-CoA thioester hydrolase [Fusobacteriaceae bacterium]|jgi:acyl-CoA thioester hydrolase|nr:thioesterase superfamily protein [Fusobacteriales bacterium]MDN5303757.1 acyl-CoA thioester hydrolase [Fusobacteriaceae bacterium]
MYNDIYHRVYYNETDQMGRVYHSNFLIWMEKARTEYFREKGTSYKELEKIGIMLPVSDIQIKYFHAALYDDLIRIRTTIKEFSRIKIEFEYEFYNEENILLAKGKSINIFTDKNGKIKRISKELFEKIK